MEERWGWSGQEQDPVPASPFVPSARLPSSTGPKLPGPPAYHQALLGEDLLLVEGSEPLGLFLQLLPQPRIALRGDRDRMASAQNWAALASMSFTKLFNQHAEGCACQAQMKTLRPP